MFFVVIGGSLT